MTYGTTKDFLETTPGNTVSYEHVAKLLFTLFQEYNIKKIGFDRWNFKHDSCFSVAGQRCVSPG